VSAHRDLHELAEQVALREAEQRVHLHQDVAKDRSISSHRLAVDGLTASK
jgi:hypothetical protein